MCKLKRCIYELNDAPCSWYKRVTKVVNNPRWAVSAYDTALFLWHNESGKLIDILTIHMDDFYILWK